MPIDRPHWRAPFSLDRLPRWPCPSCRDGRLQLEGRSYREFGVGKASDVEAGDDVLREGQFSLGLHCDAQGCPATVLAAGTFVERLILLPSATAPLDAEGHPTEFQEGRSTELRPLFMNPAPPLFPLSTSDGHPWDTHLRLAFGAYWWDANLAVCCLRAALESLMNERGIDRTLRWQDRVAGLRETLRDDLARECATAWMRLGHQAVHGGGYGKEEALDAFDLAEVVVRSASGLPVQDLASFARRVIEVRGHPDLGRH